MTVSNCIKIIKHDIMSFWNLANIQYQPQFEEVKIIARVILGMTRRKRYRLLCGVS